MKKFSVKEIKSIVKEVVKNERVNWCGLFIDYYKVKEGKKVRMKWWGLNVSDEEINEIKKRLGDKFYVGRNRGCGEIFGRWGNIRKVNDLVIRVMWNDLKFRKYVMK